jgi:hypothetical protein
VGYCRYLVPPNRIGNWSLTSIRGGRSIDDIPPDKHDGQKTHFTLQKMDLSNARLSSYSQLKGIPRIMLLLLAIGCLVGCGQPKMSNAAPWADVSTSSRDWRYWPFSQSSPWNQPLGSGARYVTVPGLSSLSAGLNYNGAWTSSVVIADETDPSARILFNPATGPQSNWTFLANGGKTCGNTSSQDSKLKSTASSVLPFPANYYSTLAIANTTLWVLPTNYQPASLNYQSTAYLPAGACPSPIMMP